MSLPVLVRRFGRQPYEPVWRAMQAFTDTRGADTPDELWLLEHDPVFTLGQAGRMEHVLAPGAIPVVPVDRGGQVTYHGPGQLVGYPIVRVASVREYVRRLEDAMIAALRDEGVAATAPDGLTGVWAGRAKIGSIGVHVSRGVTTHGFAVNVVNDLEPFTWVAACGVENAQVTSLAREKEALGQGSASMSCFRKRIAFQLAQQLGLRQRLVSPARLIAAAAAVPAVPAGASA